MLAGRRRWSAYGALCAAETGRRTWMNDFVEVHEHRTRLHLWVVRRFIQVEHWRQASIAAGSNLYPLVPSPGANYRGQTFTHLRPRAPFVLFRHFFGRQIQHTKERRVELRLDRADGDVFAVACLICAVVRSAPVDDVLAA